MRGRVRELGTWPLCLSLWLAAVASAAGCGGSSAAPKPQSDAGVFEQPDLGSVVTGTSLLAGDVDIAGLTSDEVAAVLDQTRGALAVPLSGTDVQPIDPASELVEAAGDVIFSYHNLDELDAFGDLTIWTAAHGSVPFVTGATTYLLAVSDDGTRVLATGLTSSDNTATKLVLGGVDGTTPMTLFGIALGGACNPILVFTGGEFVVAYCAPGSSEAIISAIDPSTGAVTELLTQARDALWVIPGASGLIALVDVSGNASLVPVAGGTSTPIGTNVDGMVAAPDGSAVFLLQSAGTVLRVPVGGGASSSLGLSKVVNLSGVSPDGQWLIFQTIEGLTAGFGDLWLTAAAAPGPTAQLSTDVNTTIFDDAFTADASQVLYFTDADLHGVGTFMTGPVAGGPGIVRGQEGWIVRATGGARVVYTDQYTPVAKRPGRAVLRTLDLAGDAPPTIVATHAGAYFYLSKARDRVAFSFNDGSAQSGLYVAPIP
jgi:hypothetical protein